MFGGPLFPSCRINAQAAVVGQAAPTLLVPGSPILQPPALRDTAWRTSVLIRKAGTDTVERLMAANQHVQHLVRGSAGQVELSSHWDPPFTSIDTMVFNRAGLVPETERLVYRGSRTYRYAGNRVTGTVETPDSTPRAFDQRFEQNVFAFNEVDLLARSLPFRTGATFVVPLFSEVDTDVEMDTLTVVGPDSTRRGPAQWIIRFADPAIVSLYHVDQSSRALSSVQTTQRRTGSRLRYVPAP
jgi:hypothetical protein